MEKKVFISYAHQSDDLPDKVLEFSDYLRSQGVDSEIDQYEEAPPEGWPKWMVRQIQQSEYVLVVCSELFHKRVNDYSGKDDGLGVKWETNLILQQLYNLNTINTKYIPVIFNNTDRIYIPLPLQPYTYYDLSIQSKRDMLRDRLLGVSTSNRPPLGARKEQEQTKPLLVPKERKSMFVSSIIDIDLWNEAKWKGMAYVWSADLSVPPIACFDFENEEKGREIFRNLKKQLGGIDYKDEIRLCFIEDISPANPADYKVHIGTDRSVIVEKMEAAGLKPSESLFVGVSRIHEMNPPVGSRNLEKLKHDYIYFNKLFITNVRYQNGQPAPDLDNLIGKEKVYFRKKADVIGDKNDDDYVVFYKNTTT